MTTTTTSTQRTTLERAGAVGGALTVAGSFLSWVRGDTMLGFAEVTGVDMTEGRLALMLGLVTVLLSLAPAASRGGAIPAVQRGVAFAILVLSVVTLAAVAFAAVALHPLRRADMELGVSRCRDVRGGPRRLRGRERRTRQVRTPYRRPRSIRSAPAARVRVGGPSFSGLLVVSLGLSWATLFGLVSVLHRLELGPWLLALLSSLPLLGIVASLVTNSAGRPSLIRLALSLIVLGTVPTAVAFMLGAGATMGWLDNVRWLTAQGLELAVVAVLAFGQPAVFFVALLAVLWAPLVRSACRAVTTESK